MRVWEEWEFTGFLSFIRVKDLVKEPSCTALSWPSRRHQKQPDMACRTTRLSATRGTHAISLPSDLRLCWLTNQTVFCIVLWTEDAGIKSHAHPSTNTLTNVPFNRPFYLSLLWTCGMTDKAPSDPLLPPREELHFHVYACNALRWSMVARVILCSILQ